MRRKRSARKLPPHIVLPDGRWRFKKKGSRKTTVRSFPKGKVRVMSRRKNYSRKGGARGLMGMLAPALAGAADNFINSRLPVAGVGSIAVGVLLKNKFCQDFGAYQLGHSAASMIPILGNGGGIGQTSQV
jgi:hypothetical protein